MTYQSYDLSKIQCEVMEITPAMASAWLEKNTVNRPIEQALVDRYAKLMKEGKWLLNDKTIVFDEDGFMRNGQHRCFACVLVNQSFPSVVITNVSRDAFKNLGMEA